MHITSYLYAACWCGLLVSNILQKVLLIITVPSLVQKIVLMIAGYQYSTERVVIDGKLITSRGPGTTFEFALALVEALQGKEKRDAISHPMLLKE